MVAQAEENNGPDRIIPSDAIMTWDADGAVRIKIDARGPGAEKPISIMTMVKETVDKFPNHTAYAVKEDDQWVKYTYQHYYNSIKQVARAFIKLGLEPNHGVGIIGFNSPEWFISDLASIFAGGFATGIYTTNSPEACQFVADNARCNIVVVENDQQLQKFLQVRNQLPHLKAIVQYKGKVKENYPDVFTWEQLLSMGSEDLESALQQRIESQAPNKCCALIYTSGTTGNPKGVMLSHDNLVWSGKMLIARVNGCETDAVISYLPLSHIAAQLLDIYGPFSCGASVYFAQPDALKHCTATEGYVSKADVPSMQTISKMILFQRHGLDLHGSLGKTLKEVRPTVFMGVPRVWEKMQEAMVAVGKGSGSIKRSIASWAKDVGLKGSLATMNGESKPFFFGLANKLVFEKVRTALGLERCRLCLTGAAPIMRDTLEFFYSLNIPLMEVYGMSECTGAHTLGMSDSYYIGSVGKEFPGVLTLLANQDEEGNGEICMGGRHVFMGYLNNEEKTRECIDGDGWLHSGDVGKKDKNGFMYITGRIKELIITAGGENIPPVLIEDKVRERLPCISNCMLIGDKRKFLSILLTLKSEIDADTLVPKDKLAPAAVQWCRSVGSEATTVTEVVKKTDAAVLKAIQDGINAVNKSATSRAQCIQKWTILPCDFSVPGGELGPTLKLKRPVVHSLYSATIEAFYSDSGTD